jgi:murein DD-endopeptidase MepM/ murein hydrolase activator NlpD
MKGFCIFSYTILLFFIVLDIASSDTAQESLANSASENASESVSDGVATPGLSSTDAYVEPAADAVQASKEEPKTAATNKVPAEKVRMVTREELAFHDGKQTTTVWLSIFSKVFDVTAGPEYYSENGPYNVFVARDANVPFVTGTFTPEEAARSLVDLEPNELSNLKHWLQFYIDEDRYPFIGYLEGDLYDKDGNPTETLKVINDKIESVQIEVAARKKKTAEAVAQRQKEDEERKKQKSKGSTKRTAVNTLFSYISQLFGRGDDVKKEL